MKRLKDSRQLAASLAFNQLSRPTVPAQVVGKLRHQLLKAKVESPVSCSTTAGKAKQKQLHPRFPTTVQIQNRKQLTPPLCIGVLHHPVGVLFAIMTSTLDIIPYISDHNMGKLIYCEGPCHKSLYSKNHSGHDQLKI